MTLVVVLRVHRVRTELLVLGVLAVVLHCTAVVKQVGVLGLLAERVIRLRALVQEDGVADRTLPSLQWRQILEVRLTACCRCLQVWHCSNCRHVWLWTMIGHLTLDLKLIETFSLVKSIWILCSTS